MRFEQADFVASPAPQPPGDDAPWVPVRLPDEWRRARPGTSGWGWYRIVVELPASPVTPQALLMPNRRAAAVASWVNGVHLQTDGNPRGRADVTPAFGFPVMVRIPPGTLRAGTNVVHLRMLASAEPELLHGAGRVVLGDAQRVQREWFWRLTWDVDVNRFFWGMAVAAGLIAGFLWLGQRRDRIALWYAVTLLAWSVAHAIRMSLRWWDHPVIQRMADLYVFYGLVVPAFILALRSVELRWPSVERALWVYLAVEVSRPLWSDDAGVLMRYAWPAINAALLLAAADIVHARAARPLRWSHVGQIAALVLMGALMAHEILRFVGWVNVDAIVLRHYHVPLMIVAIGATIFERHVTAVQRVERSNLELERRVAEKARELEANHRLAVEAERERALSAERQRILTDMHDGLGSALVALLHLVQSGSAARPAIEGRIREALQEMRIAIDALQPREGDLGTVLGNLRYRLDESIGASGVRLRWDVEELPGLDHLPPTKVFDLQRIVLEAITNALKHSGATVLQVAAHARDGERIEMVVSDNGRGFDTARHGDGLGLTSMRTRAARIGAALEVLSAPGLGTNVWLVMPLRQRDATTL